MSETPDPTCVVDGYRQPVADVDAAITQGFSEYASGKAEHYHTGVDFDRSTSAAATATAFARGRVVAAFDSDRFVVENGQLKEQASQLGRFQGVVLLKHTDGGQVFWSLYGHLDPSSLGRNGAASLGTCAPAGEPLGVSIESQGFHVHFEVKNKPIDSNPSPQSGTCVIQGVQSDRCWGYTQVKPDSVGYIDPIPLLFASKSVPADSALATTESGWAFRSAPLRTQADGNWSYGETVIGEALALLEVAPTPNPEICAHAWFRVARANNADCSVVGNCLGASPVSVVNSLPSAWVCGAAALSSPITFSELAVGTAVTNQYADRGIIIGGSTPFITTDGSNPSSPVLSGSPKFQGPIAGSFVKPGTTTPAVVDSVTLDAGFFNQVGSTRVQWFGLQGNLLGELRNTKAGIETITFGSGGVASWRIELTGTEAGGFATDNIRFVPAPR